MRTRRMAIIATLVVVSLSSAGCGRIQRMITPETKVVTQEATVAVPAAPVDGDIEPGLPDSVPLWPNARVTYSGQAAEAYNLTLLTSDPYDDVLAGLAVGFEDAGWEVMQDEDTTSATKVTVLTAASDAAGCIVTITDVGNGTVGIAYVITSTQ